VAEMYVVGFKYRCRICGKEVVVVKSGGGTLVCCNEPMEKSGYVKLQAEPADETSGG